MLKYSKQQQAKMDADRKSLQQMAQNDSKIAKSRQGILRGELPILEDNRSYDEMMADEIYQTELLNKNVKTLMNLVNERTELSYQLKSYGLVEYFNNNFMDILNKIGNKKLSANQVMTIINKMHTVYDNTDGVDEPLQRSDYSEQMFDLISLINNTIQELRDTGESKKASKMEDTRDRIEAFSEVASQSDNNSDVDEIFSNLVDYKEDIESGEFEAQPEFVKKDLTKEKISDLFEAVIDYVKSNKEEDDEDQEDKETVNDDLPDLEPAIEYEGTEIQEDAPSYIAEESRDPNQSVNIDNKSLIKYDNQYGIETNISNITKMKKK